LLGEAVQITYPPVVFRSVVQYPPELEGTPVFGLRVVENPKGGPGYWLGRLIGRQPIERVLSRRVIDYLEALKA